METDIIFDSNPNSNINSNYQTNYGGKAYKQQTYGEGILQNKYTNRRRNQIDSPQLRYILIICFLLLIIIMFAYLKISQKNEIANLQSSQEAMKNELIQKINGLEDSVNKHEKKLAEVDENFKQSNQFLMKLVNNFSVNGQFKKFNGEVEERYLVEQNFFCDNQNFLRSQEYEDQIKEANVNFNGKEYNIFVYKEKDEISNNINANKNWEDYATSKVLEALDNYSKSINLNKKDLYILDIGANIGWYSYHLGKYGYHIIAFEPTERNFYILKKSYCLNRDISISIINKGLYNYEKTCDYYEHTENKGKGMILCEQKDNLPSGLEKKQPVGLTKLSKFMNFLSDKKVIFMRLDVEGMEESAISSGIELITEFHVPFILMKYCPEYLKLHDVDILNFFETFEKNGYKISNSSFIDKNYMSINQLVGDQTITNLNLYISYSKIFE